MDIEHEHSEIRKRIRRVPSKAAQGKLKDELSSLVAEYHAATTPETKAPIEARLRQLKTDAEIAAGVSLWSLASMIFVGIVTFLYLLGIFLYMWGVGSSRYASIEATRPILVFTLIVAMLGFGGLLIGRALFSDEPEEQFQNRFRHAREIFLVFAGIFGTIIGFYFGASDDDDSTRAAPVIEVTTALERKVSVTVTNGAEPFLGLIELPAGAGAASLAANGRTLTAQLAADQCPMGATVKIIDGRGRLTESKIEETPAVLNQRGWTCPTLPTPPVSGAAPPADPANAVNEASPTNDAPAEG